ncbi:leukocyte cell-derived chemotaxin 1-like [Acipenser oxyrinchus oxyrinchus]|uniref:Leukocyte cell-derived chemotaxin 1 n=1 Tax=Acipenser oxyrinchus oxyrinchus TaxID=40147 RepID=A0AAD8G972_ACIOX|nr:leukocyte cell-derived chemotaxin 1-like [Acipenser oxyrinchus oxyrinchus]
MAESSEKVPIALAGPEDVEQCFPPAYTAVTVKPSSSGRMLKIGAVVLIAGAALLLFGAIGAFYFWKVTDKHVYNVHYSMSINGKVEEGSLEIDAGNNLETFKTGSGSEEAIEVHDFHIGITGIRFAGGEKCYIKAQAKAHIPDVESLNKESVSFGLEDEIMPVKFDEESLIWVAADQPVKDSSFLSTKIMDLCSDLPIFWLRPTYPKDGQRKKREVPRARRQSDDYDEKEFETDAEEGKAESETEGDNVTSKPAEEKPDFNPENPYHQMLEGEGGTMTFDPMLDHQGICCAECRRSYTHCQRICEPLGGYWPWPYDHRGCRVACRVIMPCSWWVGRILGVL